MADAEEKKIARLDFGIDKAISSLDKIDNKLKSVSDTSEQYAKKIGLALNSGVDYKTIAKSVGLSEKQLKQLSKTAQVEAIKTQNYREKQEIKTTEAIKREHAKQAKSVETLSDKISNYAKTYLIYQGFNMLKRGISDVIDEMVELENKMVQIDRVLNESGLNIDGYRDKLINLASEYGNSMDNVADITLRLAQAGYNSNEALELTKTTLLALNTAELDATQATDDMIAVMAQWGLNTGTAAEKAESYAAIIDKVNKVADKYPTTSADLMDALKKTSSAFNLAGASIDETIALITAAEVSSQRGGKAIGTALSNITQQLKDDKRLTVAESLGLDFYTDSTKKQFKDITEIFGEMSTKMQELKDAGKENSTEMQELLSLFTVFRRNVGASLLGEMNGEDSTYANALYDSIHSLGYSLQENTKYMSTAKAAQAQFNAELLKLKTEVWDSGLENVFRDMLNMGTQLVQGIGGLIDKFGLLPVTIATVTLAFTLLNKNTQASNWIGLRAKIQEVNVELKKTSIEARNLDTALKGTSTNFKGYVNSIDKGKASMAGYLGYQIKTTAQTILLTAKTIILQTVISGGITLAITALVGAIDNWVNAEQKAIEKNNKIIESSKENAQKLNEERISIEELRKEYEKLAKKDKRTTEENQKIYEIQEKLNELLKETNTQVELITTETNKQGKEVQKVNEQYDEQLAKIKAIEYEKKRQEVEDLKSAAEAAQKNLTTKSDENFIEFLKGNKKWSEINKEIKEAGISVNEYAKGLKAYSEGEQQYFDTLMNSKYGLDLSAVLDSANFEETYNILSSVKAQLEALGKTETTAYSEINSILGEMEDKYNTATEAIDKYKDALSELYSMLGFADTLSSSLQAIADSYDIEGPKKLIEDIQNINTQFSEGEIQIEEYFNKIEEKIGEINLDAEGQELEAYQAIFAATTQSLAEGLEGLISGLESGTINFADYSEGIKEAADNTLALRVEQNNLKLDDGVWKDAAGNVDEYANSLHDAIGEMEGMGDLIKTLGDNYDYIAEHANEAGEAMFKQADVGTKAYADLANSVANSLNQMKNSNAAAYQAITNAVFTSMGKNANEIKNADTYITKALNGNANALNAALNESANQLAQNTNNVTQSMGNVMSALGEAISGFQYDIKATPYISGSFGIKKDENGLPTGVELPSFGFNITGQGGSSVSKLGSALRTFGSDLNKYGSSKFRYTTLKSAVGNYSPSGSSNIGSSSGGSGGSGGSKGSGGSGGSGSSGSKKSGGGSSSSKEADAKRKEEERKRKEEEKYKKRLDKFKESLDKMTDEEEDWVKKQKQLGLLSNKDMLYVTKQRISRYKKYLDTIKKATWMNKEDRKELMKEYTEEIEDLELEYFDYLKGKLDDEIKAIEDARDKQIEAAEEAYDKDVKAAEEAANKEIEALKKVQDKRDRDREKEDYKSNRQEILDEIEYWKQRTGREAVEGLAEARKRLEELDKEWKRTKEDWKTEDDIAAEEEKLEAKLLSLEETKNKAISDAKDVADKEIAELKRVYDEKVKTFSETDKIVYDNSKISAKKLYNAYKDEFVDPLKKDLEKLNKTDKNKKNDKKDNKKDNKKDEYINYTIKSGDTLSAIAKKYNTTVKKIMAANDYIKDANKIYAGKKLKIPKFHEGGIVGGNEEAFALLKPHEVILKQEWASSLNRMMKYFDNVTTGRVNTPLTGTNITVKGDLVRIDANIKDKNDAEYLTRKIEKMLKDKFNIKK